MYILVFVKNQWCKDIARITTVYIGYTFGDVVISGAVALRRQADKVGEGYSVC